jgi:hypothetical protein
LECVVHDQPEENLRKNRQEKLKTELDKNDKEWSGHGQINDKPKGQLCVL